MLGPRITEDEELGIEYSIRVLEGEMEDDITIDGSYQLDGISFETVMEEVYPALIDQFEERFPDAEIQYYEP